MMYFRLSRIKRRLSFGVSISLYLFTLPAAAGLIKSTTFPVPISPGAKMAHARPTKAYAAISAQKSPRIDGILNDDCWNSAPVIEDMLIFPTADKPPKIVTRSQISFDRQAIYVAVRADEPQMDKLKMNQMQDGRASIWQDDCVELWFDVQHSGQESYHLIINPAGAIYTRREQDVLVQDPLAVEAGTSIIHSQSDASWKPVIQKAAKREMNYWTVELRIPAAALGLTQIIPGSVWGFNVARTRRAGGAGELSSWSGVYTSPITSFGSLKLGTASVDFKVRNPGNLAIGDNHFVLEADNKSPQAKHIRIKVLSGKNRPVEKNVILRPGQKETVTLPYTVLANGKSYNVGITATDVQSNELLFHRNYSGELPLPLQLSLTGHQIYLGEEKTLRVAVDYHAGDASLKEYSLLLALFDGDKSIAQEKLSALQGSRALVELNVGNLHSEGDYFVKATLLNAQGQPVGEAKDKFVAIESPF